MLGTSPRPNPQGSFGASKLIPICAVLFEFVRELFGWDKAKASATLSRTAQMTPDSVKMIFITLAPKDILYKIKDYIYDTPAFYFQ